MEKRAFLKSCSKIFIDSAFVQKGNTFFYDNQNGIILVFAVYKSSYGAYYYMEHGIVFSAINKHMPFPKYNELNINFGRIMFPFGKAIFYESMNECDFEELMITIKQIIKQMRPIVDGGKNKIVHQIVIPSPKMISYVLKDTPEYLGLCNDFFKEHRIPIVDY